MKSVAVLALIFCTPTIAQSLNPAVTQATVNTTICVSGWSSTIRPSMAYTNKIKRRLMAKQGIAASKISLYELDHIMPLSLGGAPRDPKNLQLQPWTGANGALAKDKVELSAHTAVCRRHVPLATAQACMRSDWHKCAAL